MFCYVDFALYYFTKWDNIQAGIYKNIYNIQVPLSKIPYMEDDALHEYNKRKH